MSKCLIVKRTHLNSKDKLNRYLFRTHLSTNMFRYRKKNVFFGCGLLEIKKKIILILIGIVNQRY